jgi:hypothetical protein
VLALNHRVDTDPNTRTDAGIDETACNEKGNILARASVDGTGNT